MRKCSLVECGKCNFFSISDGVVKTCPKAKISTKPYKTENGYTQHGGLSFIIPETTENWKISLTFSKSITTIDVYEGEDESCIGEICTFNNNEWNGAQVKDTKISLTYQIGFETKSTTNVIAISFNGYSVCSVSAETGTLKPTIEGK